MAVKKAAPVDLTNEITLARKLDGMTKEDMIVYAREEMGQNVDPDLDVQTIREKLLIVEAAKREDARNVNLASLEMVMTLVKRRNDSGKLKLKTNDPPLQVRFHNKQSPGADLECAPTEPYGFYGEKNKYGFKKAPRWHLFDGEVYILPSSLIEHLKNLTYVTGKPIFDPATGMQSGSIPIIRQRFVLEFQLTREQYALLGNMTGAQPPGKGKHGT